MNTPDNDLIWFVHVIHQAEVLTDEHCISLVQSIGQQASTTDAAHALKEWGWIDDDSFLQEAMQMARDYAQGDYELPDVPGFGAVSENTSEQASPHDTTSDAAAFSPEKPPSIGDLEQLEGEALRDAFQALILHCHGQDCSDLHITSGSPPRMRRYGMIVHLEETTLSEELVRKLNESLLSSDLKSKFHQQWDLDYPLSLQTEDMHEPLRFRVNLFEHKEGISGVYHMVPREILSIEELGFSNPNVIRNLLTYHNGIILVTGPVGSGKTTTLASLINELNGSRQDHIITVEDPIEIVQHSDQCIVTQRETKKHTLSFQSALKSALREDPDIIVIGEMRDLETIEMAITAAETGHLVIGTLHTREAASTLSRLLDVFPPSQQSQIRAMTSGSLRGILCQKLLPSLHGGRVLASELLVNTNAVANMIREGKETGLKSVMQTGRKQGMRLMDESVLELFQNGSISAEVAQANIRDKSLIQNMKKG